MIDLTIGSEEQYNYILKLVEHLMIETHDDPRSDINSVIKTLADEIEKWELQDPEVAAFEAKIDAMPEELKGLFSV